MIRLRRAVMTLITAALFVLTVAQTTSAASGPSLKVSPPTAAPGESILVTGTNFSSPGRIYNVFINVRDSKGIGFDTRSKEITCVESDDVVLIYLQTYGIGCSADAGGPIAHTDSNGNFRAVVTVPSGISAGTGKVCANSPDVYEACAPFTIGAGYASDTNPQRSPDPQAAPIDPAGATAAVRQTIQDFNDTFALAINNQDASLMADTVVANMTPQVVQIVQHNLDSGVVDVNLQNLDWGPIDFTGTSAKVADTETWNVTYTDGSTDSQSGSFVYSLTLANGTWVIQSIKSQ